MEPAMQLAVTTVVVVAALAAMAVAGVQKRWLEWRPPGPGQATRRPGEQLNEVLVVLAAVSALIVALVLATGSH
jgi:hypothetical protein